MEETKIYLVKTLNNKHNYFTSDHVLNIGTKVIVEGKEGLEFGEIIKLLPATFVFKRNSQILPIIRIAAEEDFKQLEFIKRKERKAFKICRDKVSYHKLPMNLSYCAYLFDLSKVTFYFFAENRVDFRELVKDLAQALKTRVELHQIGSRDEAKMLSGIGPCGIKLCCSAFLENFMPVSVKMAKDQSLPLNPTKISGVCGRLMCCLKYENDFYEEVRSRIPTEGHLVVTDEGQKGKVISINALKETLTLTCDDETLITVSACKTKCSSECRHQEIKESISIDLSKDVLPDDFEDKSF